MAALIEVTSGVYERELRVAVELARRAGEAALQFYGKPLRVEHKEEFDEPVTQADRALNEMIVRHLCKAFPEDGVLAEESVDTERRLSRERVWMVDPLDGTKGFIAGTGDFAVQIGLSVAGRSALGVLYAPATDVLYWAARGHGAWVLRPTSEAGKQARAERLRVTGERELSRMRLAESRSHRGPRMDALVRALGVRAEVKSHSVGIKVGLLVERQADLYIHLSPKTKQWDTCAPEAVLAEAGGRMTDLWGEPMAYNSPDVLNRNGLVASNGAAHDAVIERIGPLLAEFGRERV
ncbi:MAG: 3'(2'),5'-bisphosphate nucleotidase CysQ [Acidobacteria bacterium]|nr:MAG: 3'(2'),5'-bisphosphate nucleotidase CysQ [Acidobacteriota bacterium]PYS84801.1 MAG: 3'(2'),5'-bisphosphate nucleotidase CysQ [Acidobacteriota bacterium]